MPLDLRRSTFAGENASLAAVVTGEDFTFGARRGGNAGVLREVGAQFGLAAEAVGPVALENEPVSSSRIRKALAEGDPGTATRLLTRPFAIRGTVQHGDKRGRRYDGRICDAQQRSQA